MGLTDWINSKSRPGAEINYGPPAIGAMAGRTDGNGVPIIEFAPQMVEALKLAESFRNFGSIYRTSAPVRICVDFIARNIAQLGLKAFRQDGDQQVPERDHPVSKLLARPNRFTTRFQLMQGTVSDVAIYDNAYWLKRFATRGSFEDRARFLFRIPAWGVEPEGGNWLTGPENYRVNTGGGTTDFSPDQIVHFKGYNPLDMRVGVSALLALSAVLNEDAEASEHRANFFKNAARMEGVIERPKDAPKWSPGTRTRFLAAWRAAYAGRKQAGVTGLLEDSMHFNPVSFSAKDSEFIEGREFTLDLVATAYHIPLAVLSRNATPTFASMKEFRTMLYVDTLGPWNAMLEQQMWLQLLPDFPDTEDLFLEFNIDEKLQGDFEAQVTSMRNGVQVPYISVNAALKLLGLPPVDDPLYDKPARPQAYLYGDQAPKAASAPAAPDQGPDSRLDLAPAAFDDGEVPSQDMRDIAVLDEALRELEGIR